MYFKLSKEYSFRGWKRLPYAIRALTGERALKRPFFFDKKHFMLALSCNGVEDVDLDALDEEGRAFLAGLEREGIITSSEEPMGSLEPSQRYRIYEGAYLESIHWAITGKCNYKCRHCLVSSANRHHPEPSIEQIERVADQIHRCGIRLVDLTGGEPLVRSDFLDVVKMLSDRGIQIRTMFTNAAFLTGELLDKLVELGQRPAFQVSYDGLECHDWLRGVRGAEQEVRAACELLGERHVPYAVAMCIHKGNRHTLRPLWNYLKDHGCRGVSVNAPQELGEWKAYAEEYSLSREEVWETYAEAIEGWYEDGMPVGLTLDGFFAGEQGKVAYKVPCCTHLKDDVVLAKLPYCESVRYTAHVSPEGNIMPCMGFADSAIATAFPNLFEEGMTMGKATSDPASLYFKVQRTTVGDMVDCVEENPECADCEHLRSCLGGCMLEGITPEGNHLHRDESTCWFHKHLGEAAVRAVADAAIERFVPGGLAAIEESSEEDREIPYGGDPRC